MARLGNRIFTIKCNNCQRRTRRIGGGKSWYFSERGGSFYETVEENSKSLCLESWQNCYRSSEWRPLNGALKRLALLRHSVSLKMIISLTTSIKLGSFSLTNSSVKSVKIFSRIEVEHIIFTQQNGKMDYEASKRSKWQTFLDRIE